MGVWWHTETPQEKEQDGSLSERLTKYFIQQHKIQLTTIRT